MGDGKYILSGLKSALQFFPSWHVLEHTLQTETKALYKFYTPYSHFHPFSHTYLSAIPCRRISTSPVTLQFSNTEGQVGFPNEGHEFPKDLHCWVSLGTWISVPSGRPLTLQTPCRTDHTQKGWQRNKRFAPESPILVNRDYNTGNLYTLQYISTRPAFVGVSLIAQTD